MKGLFNRDFLLLWLGLSVSRLGDAAGFLAVMWWVQSETGSTIALGAVAMAEAVPRILLSPLAGVAADRVSRKTLIVGMDVVRGLIYLFLAFAAWSGSLTVPILLVARVLSSASGQFFSPAISASVPQLVPRVHLERANSLNQLSANLAFTLGTASSGILIALIGIPALLFLDALSYLASALSESFIRLPVKLRGPGLRPSVWSDLTDGWRYAMGKVMLPRILSVAVVINFFFAPLFVLLPKFVAEDLGRGPELYGYLFSAFTAGALLAMILISSTTIVHRNPWMVMHGVTLQGVMLLAFALGGARFTYLPLASFFLGGFFSGVVDVFFISILQRITSSEYMGRVFGLLNTTTSALQPLAQGGAGLIASVVALRTIYSVSAAAVLGAGLRLAALPGLREFLVTPPEEPEAEAAPLQASISAE